MQNYDKTPLTNDAVCLGMVFNINIGLADLDNPDGEEAVDKKYALFVGDMLLIGDEQHVLFTKDKKKARNISIFLKVIFYQVMLLRNKWKHQCFYH